MKITAIIPARYASTRFPGKALAEIIGKPMVQHVYERTAKAGLVSEVIVATDDERVAEAVRAFGGRVEMTSATHETGTDRLAEVAARIDADIIVNVQGDEPLIEPAMIDEAIAPLVADASIRMGTLKSRIKSLHDFLSPNVVKVVTDREGDALYFSRSPLPNFRDKWNDLKDEAFVTGRLLCYKHVGLYVYRRDFLLAFARMAPTPLELAEKLEQLRVLENGFRIRVVETSFESIGVDTPSDLDKVVEKLSRFQI
ncbi:3-deoxy-D-manno-octulosonate cytidylyltransferase [Geobacter metallireducens RCH3]|uniref:3-deoxy-manno-octulosonate cytidylyltransferase n=1 Tax=Geobacter metallireducens (strain ATCC 53774 / DSM 7210 / GS-15) TaxID=269799 RepID=KDSB_GEOMG|nr:3-deoxy-manno-octulosonate cytidylyltransferase [Geobacter metallireducens]Q39W63.1 RecName: Full=3-deoxy-manno-octulosonate cytidylyltransferase; AltName: Full=CMP-2-keto-3-deoxyoctulosonic acid synthase; Short=CKS; Short=CMP-KDO synthase [Geobacter metallireducens GS-15]ABB31511.1 3-deoxy-D-manno-octulosonate cytidylyltransferase [Geobacter metallireducens GS-15]EHP88399.1 3-deoxy-D-manno-octulosonate cytidylyltransferase [Geobacter metallireducens RCH3]